MKYERCMDATVFCVSEIDHELILASSVHKLTEAKNLWVRKSWPITAEITMSCSEANNPSLQWSNSLDLCKN